MAYGFYFDMTRCVSCKVCQIACKDRLGLETAGPIPRLVRTFEVGTYPAAKSFHLSVACNHCSSPACVANCPTGAMHVDENGIVLHDDDVCIGCKTCMSSCPYEAPQYDEASDLIVKCDTCKALRGAGMNPVCVDACIMRAIEFGDVDELKAKHGDGLVNELPALGSAETTSPNLYIKAHEWAVTEGYTEVVL